MPRSFISIAALFAVVGVSSLALADKVSPGTKGTVTAWEGTKAIAVEACDPKEGGDYDYVGCSKVLRDRVVQILCKRGPGKYNWGFQVSDEKPYLMQSTSCK